MTDKIDDALNVIYPTCVYPDVRHAPNALERLWIKLLSMPDEYMKNSMNQTINQFGEESEGVGDS